MKKLNTITLDDILSGYGIWCTYKQFTILYHNGNINLYYKNHNIDCFGCTSKNIGCVKARIKTMCNRHDFKTLYNLPIDTLYKMGFKSEEVEKLHSYYVLENDTNREHKKLNKYLMNEIKEHFIYRLIRA